MKPQELVALVKQVTYKPGWRLDAMVNRRLKWVEVRIVYETTAVHRSKFRLPLMAEQRVTWSDLKLMDEYDVMGWLERFIEQMERHEMHEWLKLRGLSIVEPDPEG